MSASTGTRTKALGLLSICLALVWAFIRVGPQTSTGISGDAARALLWPNPELDPLQSYTRTSPTGALVFKAIHIYSTSFYFWIHLVAALVALLLIAYWCYRSVDSDTNRFRAARISVLGPVAASVFISLGNYDPFTLIGVAALLFAWRRSSMPLLVIAGIYLGFQHFEQGIFAVLILGIGVLGMQSVLPEQLRGLRSPLWALLGVLGGKALLSLYFITVGINATAGRSAYITDSSWTRLAVKESINHFPTLLTSLFAGTWLVVILVLVMLRGRRDRVYLLLALALALFVSVITLAQTRVFVMTTVALLSVMIVIVLSRYSGPSTRMILIGAEALAWIVIPQHLYISPGQGAHILGTNALDYLIILVHQVPGLS